MDLVKIESVDTLKHYLHVAMQLEHATIPPYLTALYSIHPGTNSDANHILRVVVVEEMLHLTLAANLLNAIGGEPNLTVDGFVPHYPTPLPDGESDFEVPLQRFSKQAIETFLKIERPGKAPDEPSRRLSRRPLSSSLSFHAHATGLTFYSIGEFYEEIARGFEYLYESEGPGLFCGKKSYQASAEYYYSGGGELSAVTDIESARAVINLITGQGEGMGGGIYDTERELAHFYRFEQLLAGRYYQPNDMPHEPTGPKLHVDWDAVYPLKTNARLSDYDNAPELKQAAIAFNQAYGGFLAYLTSAYTGSPNLLLDAVPQMFRVRDKMLQLIHNPLPGSDGLNAAPTFEIGETGA